MIIGGRSILDDGMVWLISLNKDFGGIEVTAADAADNLSEELKSMLLGGEIGETKATIGLDDADGGEERKIKAFCDGLSTDDDVDVAVFYLVVESV